MTITKLTGMGKVFGIGLALGLAGSAPGLTSSALAQSFTVLRSFNGKAQGGTPYGGVIFDSAGNLYGTAGTGGNPNTCISDNGCGLVYKLLPAVSGQWQETVLFTFRDAATGGTPIGGLFLDTAGNLFGVTETGGGSHLCAGAVQGCGLVYKLSPTSNGAWQESVPQTFDDGADGGIPVDGLISDASGNLYGTTTQGGNLSGCQGFGCGVVFRLSPNGAGGWQQTVLYSFSGGTDGSSPYSHLVMDATGNLYGTTFQGGKLSGCFARGCGVVFELSPSSSGTFTESVLYTFKGNPDGANPQGALVMDAAGNLYGTTAYGGTHGYGTAFELTPVSGGWKETLLHSFTGGSDGSNPFAGVTLDGAGNLYGVGAGGGNLNDCTGFGCGVVFKLAQTSGVWRQTILHAFTGHADGSGPSAPLTLNPDGNFYGTTPGGGAFDQGVVFRITP